MSTSMVLDPVVVIGHSIAEGHPGTHGRLHDAKGQVDLAKPNEPGQISYHLELLTGWRVYNHGIGSQSTAMVRARWARDVLGEERPELVPPRTLPEPARAAVLIAGICDITLARTVTETHECFSFLIDSALQHNIRLVVANLGPHPNLVPEQKAAIRALNTWLEARIKAAPGVRLFDFYGLTNDPEHDGYPKAGVFVQTCHPTPATYAQMAGIIAGLLKES